MEILTQYKIRDKILRNNRKITLYEAIESLNLFSEKYIPIINWKNMTIKYPAFGNVIFKIIDNKQYTNQDIMEYLEIKRLC